MSGGVQGRPMTRWPEERWAHPGWWALGMGASTLFFAVVGAWQNATTPGDFLNPLILIAFLIAALLGCITLLFVGIYIFGSLVFRSRRAYADEEL